MGLNKKLSCFRPCQLVGRQASATVTFQTSNSKASISWSCSCASAAKHGSPDPFQLSAAGRPLEIEPRPPAAGGPCTAPGSTALRLYRAGAPCSALGKQHARRSLAWRRHLKKPASPFGASRVFAFVSTRPRDLWRCITGRGREPHTEQAAKRAKRTKAHGGQLSARTDARRWPLCRGGGSSSFSRCSVF